MHRLLGRLGEVTTVAALVVTLSTVFASMSWISAGKAGGQASDRKTAALGIMILRLEALTEASNALVQAQNYLTQGAMFYAQAQAAVDPELAAALESMGDQAISVAQARARDAEEWKARGEGYYASYEQALAQAQKQGQTSDRRSTAALIFNVSAAVASLTAIFKRWRFLLLYLPVFSIGLYYFVVSFV